MDPNTISTFVGIIGQLFRFSFPTAIIAAILYIVASLGPSRAAWAPILEVVIWVCAALSAPLIILVAYIAIAVWWANRG